MSNDELELRPGDMRRGCSMLAHAAAEDREGVDAVLDEAKRAGRATELTVAVVALVVDGFAGFCNPVNVKTYSDAAAKHAAHEIEIGDAK